MLTEYHVAPHAGAWIEIASNETPSCGNVSLPMRERGLKYARSWFYLGFIVAPHAGAWIEM